MPAIAKLLRAGAKAGDAGLLTQARPTLAPAGTAWRPAHGRGCTARRITPLRVNGQAFGNRAAASTLVILQAETLAQAGRARWQKRSPRSSGWRPQWHHQRPTVDFRAFLLGRGVATNYISPDDNAAL